MKSSFRCTPPPKNPVETLAKTPWLLARQPFQVSPNTYYVSGQTWVGCYLIDTGEGLILIDTAIPESLYMLIDSIYSLGYRPGDIKKILLSHGHFYHFGAAAALKAMTGASIYLSKEDWDFVCKAPEDAYVYNEPYHPQEFAPDCFYDEDKPVLLGNISIRTRLSPGHTPGCTSMFWEEINPADGRGLTLAMHGGVGAFSMSDDYYANHSAFQPWMRERFLSDCEMMKSIHVDIALPSHPNQIEIFNRAGTYTHERQPYRDESVWGDFLDKRAAQVKKLIGKI